MVRVLVSGTLFQAPESRSLKNGGLCVTAIVKAKEATNDNRTRYWHIAALSETVQSVLMHLSHGDAVVVQGTLKTEIHERNGEFAVSCGVVAERVLSNVANGEAGRKGGQSVPDEKRSFSQDHELASEAGRKSGQASRGRESSHGKR